MISITNRVASDRIISVYVVAETTIGVLAYPAAGDIVGAFDITYPKQVPEYSNSRERVQSRDILDRCQGQMPAGEWGFSTYWRPKGAGILPQEHNLLLALTGDHVVTPATSIEYILAVQKPSVSLWFLVDHTMIFCKGATVGNMSFDLEECSLIYQWSGMFMQMGTVGTEVLSGNAAVGLTLCPIANTDKFSAGGLIVLADSAGNITDDNGGAGYEIESIQDGVSLTVTDALLVGQAAGGFVAPFDPGGSVGGNKLESRRNLIEIATVSKPVVAFNMEVTDEPDYLDREKTSTGYPISYVETQREVSGEINLLYRRDDADEINLALEGTERPIKFTGGDTTGYQVEIAMPRTKSDAPTIEENDPTVEQTIPYTALGTTGEDSYSIKYL